MGMYKNIQAILDVLRNDEILLRLLYYPPKNRANKVPDPLDPSLENILDIDEDWIIRNNTILIVQKDDELTDERKCMLFAYLGERHTTRNSLTAQQEVIFDIYCHADYENGDMRSSRIGDRIHNLFTLERIAGFGKTFDSDVSPISRTPSQFVGYQHIFTFGDMKK